MYFSNWIFSNFPSKQDSWSGIKHLLIMNLLKAELLIRWIPITYFLFFSEHCFSSVKEWWVLQRSTTHTLTPDLLQRGTNLTYFLLVDGLLFITCSFADFNLDVAFLPCSCCSWRGSLPRCILCSLCVERLWKIGRETPSRRSLWGSSSWSFRSRTTLMPDR